MLKFNFSQNIEINKMEKMQNDNDKPTFKNQDAWNNINTAIKSSKKLKSKKKIEAPLVLTSEWK